jgi:hypothetical protein
MPLYHAVVPVLFLGKTMSTLLGDGKAEVKYGTSQAHLGTADISK